MNRRHIREEATSDTACWGEGGFRVRINEFHPTPFVSEYSCYTCVVGAKTSLSPQSQARGRAPLFLHRGLGLAPGPRQPLDQPHAERPRDQPTRQKLGPSDGTALPPSTLPRWWCTHGGWGGRLDRGRGWGWKGPPWMKPGAPPASDGGPAPGCFPASLRELWLVPLCSALCPTGGCFLLLLLPSGASGSGSLCVCRTGDDLGWPGMCAWGPPACSANAQ